MDRQELLALFAVLLIIVGFPVTIFAYQYLYLPTTYGQVKVIELVARAPEAGGWTPEVITVNRGDIVRLRIIGQDVMHGFAIGKMGIDAGPIIPGEVTTVEFVADRVGRFTYYCNVWCSPYHYRMRGTLEVMDPVAPGTLPIAEGGPDFVELDIDSPHEAKFYPTGQPSAARGRTLAERVELPPLGDLRVESPSSVFQAIRMETGADLLSDEEIWDLVAYLWTTTTTPERLAVGKALYAKNCAACHGESGAGDGPGGRYLGERPASFTDARSMAGGSSQIYYAKIRRGGMGTGMPYWGTIFTEEETWEIVDYLWTFLFDAAGAAP